MIQRIQTIYLLLAAVAGFFILQLPLFEANMGAGTSIAFYAKESLPVFALAVVAALLGFVAIFLFKNRGLQKRMVLVGILLSAVLLALVVYLFGSYAKTPEITKTSYGWGALLPIAMLIFFFMGWLNIRKDEKLIKSLDRLR